MRQRNTLYNRRWRLQHNHMSNEILTLKEAAAVLQIPTKLLREAAARGEVPARRIARQWRFSRFALHHWLSGGAAPSLETRLRHAGSLAESPFFAEVMASVEANRPGNRCNVGHSQYGSLLRNSWTVSG